MSRGEAALLGEREAPHVRLDEEPHRGLPRLARRADVGDRPQRHLGQVERRVERALDRRVAALGRLRRRSTARGEVAAARADRDALARDLHADPAEPAVGRLVRRRVAEEVVAARLAADAGEAGREVVRVGQAEAPGVGGQRLAPLAALARLREPRAEVAELACASRSRPPCPPAPQRARARRGSRRPRSRAAPRSRHRGRWRGAGPGRGRRTRRRATCARARRRATRASARRRRAPARCGRSRARRRRRPGRAPRRASPRPGPSRGSPRCPATRCPAGSRPCRGSAA